MAVAVFDMPVYDIDVIQQPEVDFVGLQELEKWLDEILAKYMDLVITEDQCKDIKKEMAELNKLKDSIKDAGRQAIELLSQPLDKIRKKVDSLTKKIDGTYTHLKMQVDNFDEEERKAKESRIAEMIKVIKAGYHPELDDFDIAVQRKWTNKSCSMKSIELEVYEIARDELARRRAVAEAKKQELSPSPAADIKKAPTTEPELQKVGTASVQLNISHDTEIMSTSAKTKMQIIVTWDSSADEEIRALLRQVKEKALSFSARKFS